MEISMIIMVILDQIMPISLILKIEKKIKNLKFVNCTFSIQKNVNKTSIQPHSKIECYIFYVQE